MDVGALFGLSVLLSFCAFGVVTILYIQPRLRVMSSRGTEGSNPPSSGERLQTFGSSRAGRGA